MATPKYSSKKQFIISVLVLHERYINLIVATFLWTFIMLSYVPHQTFCNLGARCSRRHTFMCVSIDFNTPNFCRFLRVKKQFEFSNNVVLLKTSNFETQWYCWIELIHVGVKIMGNSHVLHLKYKVVKKKINLKLNKKQLCADWWK